MKIYSKNEWLPSGNGKAIGAFVLFLDTEKTGDPNIDTVNCALDINLFDFSDQQNILDNITAMLTSLLYAAYGVPRDQMNMEPITDLRTTNFDPNYPNGVNTGVYDK